MTGITTHVLDTSKGRPAVGVELRLWHRGQLLFSGVTNEDGRCPGILGGDEMVVGRYRLEFEIGRYFAAQGLDLPDPPFLDCVAIDFGVSDPDGHYHVPLLVSPFGYSSHRGI
jgi:5-hydroxyisourate hydrolase